MNTRHSVAPRIATALSDDLRREGRTRRRLLPAAVAAVALAAAIGACSPASSSLPSVALPSSLPSIDASAVASAAAGAAMTALDQVDAAIAANQTSGNLTADDASSLTQLTGALRTALQSGDTSGIQTAVTNLTTKVDSFASKLNGDAGTQLKNAITALKAAVPSS